MFERQKVCNVHCELVINHIYGITVQRKQVDTKVPQLSSCLLLWR